jgi:hypothetical protein
LNHSIHSPCRPAEVCGALFPAVRHGARHTLTIERRSVIPS